MALLIIVVRKKDWNTAAFLAAVIRQLYEERADFCAGHAASILQECTQVVGAYNVLPILVPATVVDIIGKVD